MNETDTRPDDQVRAEDQARVGNDAVERRAVGGGGGLIRSRRADPTADVPRAESRGYYRDLDGRRRIVGAGQPIPDGWERIGTADLADRDSGPVGTPLEGEPATAEAEGGRGSRKRARKPAED